MSGNKAAVTFIMGIGLDPAHASLTPPHGLVWSPHPGLAFDFSTAYKNWKNAETGYPWQFVPEFQKGQMEKFSIGPYAGPPSDETLEELVDKANAKKPITPSTNNAKKFIKAIGLSQTGMTYGAPEVLKSPFLFWEHAEHTGLKMSTDLSEAFSAWCENPGQDAYGLLSAGQKAMVEKYNAKKPINDLKDAEGLAQWEKELLDSAGVDPPTATHTLYAFTEEELRTKALHTFIGHTIRSVMKKGVKGPAYSPDGSPNFYWECPCGWKSTDEDASPNLLDLDYKHPADLARAHLVDRLLENLLGHTDEPEEPF